MRIAVLASGSGSNLQALIDASNRGSLEAQVVVVVSHDPAAGALERARQAGIAAIALPLDDRTDRTARMLLENELLELLQRFDPDIVVLAGWMLILSAGFLARCSRPLLNVHPALLPLAGSAAQYLDDLEDGTRYPVLRGAHAVRDALTLGLPLTGVSVHVVTPEVDAGPVVLREVVEIAPGDDEESLYRRIKAVEHRLLPEAVRLVLTSVHAPDGGVYA